MADDERPADCIFCSIITGKFESKKVYEDDKFLAILDIRPATPGHVLFIPKTHVPILPLLPEEETIAFFATGTKVANAIREAMITPRVTMFIANGAAAGQRMPHLIMHLIPREKGDGLDMLDIEQLTVAQADTLALAPVFTQATAQSLVHRKRDDLAHRIHKKRTPENETEEQHDNTQTQAHSETHTASPHITPPQKKKEISLEYKDETQTPQNNAANAVDEKQESVEFSSTSDALEAALAMAPDLRRLIIAQPDLVTDYVQRSPKLAKLFEGVNIRALSIALQRQEAERQAKAGEQQKNASTMSEQELFQFIDGNQGLRSWLLEHPEELASRVHENPRLAAFFAGVDIKELAKRYRAYRQMKGDA